jgi:hypothetical protein
MEEDGELGRMGSLPFVACELPVWCSDLITDVVTLCTRQ